MPDITESTPLDCIRSNWWDSTRRNEKNNKRAWTFVGLGVDAFVVISGLSFVFKVLIHGGGWGLDWYLLSLMLWPLSFFQHYFHV